MFEKESMKDYTDNLEGKLEVNNESRLEEQFEDTFIRGAICGYDKANEWHYVKDGGLPRQDGNTCFSVEVLADNKKWVYYRFDFGKWFCGNKEVKVNAWKEIVLPEEFKNE